MTWRNTPVSDPYPLEEKVAAVCGQGRAPDGWRPTGETRGLYVDLSEPIVRMAVDWQDDAGRFTDPHEPDGAPGFSSFTAARFVGALGFLIGSGRCLDLVEVCARSMDVTCQDLFHAHEKPVRGVDFFTKELMRGFLALECLVETDRRDAWARWLGGYDPELNYAQVFSKQDREALHNIVTFAVAGESWKQQVGLADNSIFIERYLETQRERFTAYGMYRDPGDPLTYDFTARMNLSLLLFFGYRGKHFDFLDEMLRRGGLTTLFYLSSLGQTPFGGRSNQSVFNEATIAVISEYEARRYKELGDHNLAGAFKRTARLATLSIRRWLEMDPPRFVKNSFAPSSHHGKESRYGPYSNYLLLVASQLGFAHLLADDEIEEGPAFFEKGGYVVELPEAFHKVFASCGGYHVEIDTNGDPHYDATGLGRVHHVSVPAELGLSTPIPSRPNFIVSGDPPPRSVAIGPGWQDADGGQQWLSEWGGDSANARVARVSDAPDGVVFEVIYSTDVSESRQVTERYVIGSSGIEVTDRVSGDIDHLWVQVPLLDSNGMDPCEIEMTAKAFEVRSGPFRYLVECLFPSEVEVSLEPFPAPNRNGVYRVGCFRVAGNEIRYRLTLSSTSRDNYYE